MGGSELPALRVRIHTFLSIDFALLLLFSIAVLLYAAFSLTVVRMLPVALCLSSRLWLDREILLFPGWFGPRGLA